MLLEEIDKGVKPYIVMIFKYIDSEKKSKETKVQILERINFILRHLGINEKFSRYILELYLLNYRSDGDYSNLNKGNFVDPRYQKAKRTTNENSNLFTVAKLPFEGSNLRGYWDKDWDGKEYYVVTSYGWYPVYIFKDDLWYENSKRYSSTTSKQMHRSSPVSRYNDDLEERTILATPEQMRMLTQRGGFDEVVKDKKIKLTKNQANFISSKLKNLSYYGPNIKIKYKIKEIQTDSDNKINVVVDVYDVTKREGNKLIPTPENYLKNELPGVTKELVERILLSQLGEDFKEFLGPRLGWSEKPGESHLLKFEFNHLREN